ncbi:hypothetical protein THARTR1_03796 [Trichoderma harzianum]|uniref:Uncharacterized protein n=1 Tax=Trichoderma harzianum TaxID=5544 RepID=A0A2K0UEP8_TRIHA|nr:hypothetical protein THARTR1_03796 [Trichoderma harzianum]
MSKASTVLSGLQTSLTDTTSELRGDSQSDLDSDSAREEGVILSPEGVPASAPQATNEAMGAVLPDP